MKWIKLSWAFVLSAAVVAQSGASVKVEKNNNNNNEVEDTDQHTHLRHLVQSSSGDFAERLQQQRELFLCPAAENLGSFTIDPVAQCVLNPDTGLPAFDKNGVFEASEFGCTAKDLTYVSCRLVPENGGPCIDCDCGDPVDVKIECIVINDTKSERAVAYVVGQLIQSDGSCSGGDVNKEPCNIALCKDVTPFLLPGVPTPVLFDEVIQWDCGANINFQYVILGSKPTSSTCASLGVSDKCNTLGPKCDEQAEFPIAAPVSISASVECATDGSTDEIVTYTIAGGTGPYDVTFECPLGTEQRSVTQAMEGEYEETFLACDGEWTVIVTDSTAGTAGTGCTATADPVSIECCFNAYQCKDLPNDTQEGCDAIDIDFGADKSFSEIFIPNAEACEPVPNSFVFSDGGPLGNICTGLSITRTYTATLPTSSGGTETFECTETRTIKDTTAPDLTVPADPAAAECPACTGDLADDCFPMPTATDCDVDISNIINVGEVVFVEQSTCTGGLVGTYTRSLSVTDQCGNGPVTDSQTVTVQDTLPPTIDGVGGPVTAECPTCTGAALDGCFSDPTLSDACGVSQDDLSPDTAQTIDGCGKTGEWTRTWDGVDLCGNAATSVSQKVTVQDNSGPELTGCPDPDSGFANLCNGGILDPAIVTALDTCDGEREVTYECCYDRDLSPDTDPIGGLSRRWSATDLCDNLSDCTESVYFQPDCGTA